MRNTLRDTSTWSMLASLLSWTKTNCRHCNSDDAQAMAELEQVARVARLSSLRARDAVQRGATSAAAKNNADGELVMATRLL